MLFTAAGELESISSGTNNNLCCFLFFCFFSVCFTLRTWKAPGPCWGISDTDVSSVIVCVFSLWQAGEGLGIGCGAGEQIARPGSAPEEAAEGAEFWLLPAQDPSTQIWSILPNWYPVYHIPRCLHVCHPPGAQVRHENQNLLLPWVVWLASVWTYRTVSEPSLIRLRGIWFVVLTALEKFSLKDNQQMLLWIVSIKIEIRRLYFDSKKFPIKLLIRMLLL